MILETWNCPSVNGLNREEKSVYAQKEDKILEFATKGAFSAIEIAKKLNLSKDTIMRCLHELNEQGKLKYEVNGKTFFWSKNEVR